MPVRLKGLVLAAVALAVLLACVVAAAADPVAEPPLAAQEVLEGEAPAAEVPPLTDPQAAAELPHTELDRSEALELLRQTFGQILKATAGPFAELEVEDFLSGNVAVVTSDGQPESGGGGDQTALLESTIPLRTLSESGKAEQVDLGLQPSGGALEAENGLVEAAIPTELGQGIQLGEVGVGIEIEGVAGQRNASTTDESVAFYPNVSTDTDLAVAATPTGVETLTQLRSPDSPASQTFQLSLPKGAELVASKDGGAEVIDGARTLVSIPAPTGLDAVGNDVPVQLTVSGDSLILEASLSSSTVLPALIDPLFETYTWGGGTTAGLENWIGEQTLASPFTHAYKANCTQSCSGYIPDGKPGLWVNAAAGWNDASGWSGGFHYLVPRWEEDWTQLDHAPTSYIANASYYGPGFWVRSDTHASPYVLAGLWWPEGAKWLSSYSHGGNEGNLYMGETWKFPGSNAAKEATFGLVSTDTHNLSYARELFIGYITLELTDEDKPEPASVGAVPGWVNNQATGAIPFKFTDPGLGVYSITAKDQASHSWTTQAGCVGGVSNPCPRTWSSTDTGRPTVKYDPSVMAQGIDYLELSASDPAGHQSNQALGSKPATVVKAQVKVDHTAPALTLAGTLTEQGKVGPKLGSYTLSANATDGAEGAPQSGVTKTTIAVDGKVVDEVSPGCSTQNCSISREWTLDSSQYASGSHTVKVTATDGVDLSTTKEISIYLQQPPPPMVSLSGTMTEQESIGTERPRYKLHVDASAEAGQYGPSTYSTAFGSYGTANGAFNHPAGMAVDSKDFLWVADQGNSRIQKLKEGGEYVTKFGTVGSEAGKLNHPSDLAIDAKGSFWIADTANNRVDEFNEKREFVMYTNGNAGTGKPFSEPGGIAADAKGNIWVADTHGARLVELNSAGEAIRVAGNKGELSEPAGIDIDLSGDIWVADRSKNKILEFSETGQLLNQYGSEGSAPLQFMHPATLNIDVHGNVWVGDEGNDRVQELDENGEYVGQFGSEGTGNGQFSASSPMGLATDIKGNIFVADAGNNRIQRWAMPAYVITGLGSLGSAGSSPGQFSHPAGVAVDAKGNLWVADWQNTRIQEFDPDGKYLRSIGSASKEGGELSYVSDVAVDGKGHLWVTDTGKGLIKEFSESGEYLGSFHPNCTAALGESGKPCYSAEALAVDKEGHLWVADTYNARIEEFNEAGERLTVFNAKGPSEALLYELTGIAIGPGGNIWTVDWHNNRVLEFTPEGEFVMQFGSEGAGAGKFRNPDVIDIDDRGNVWVADEKNNRVEEFNHRGEYVAQFGSVGTEPGQFKFLWPMGIAVDSKGNLWVADPKNNRVQKWNYANTTSEVKTEVMIDGKGVEVGQANCLGNTCPDAINWTLESPSYLGEHIVKVKATDSLGRGTTKTLDVGVQSDKTKPALEVSGELANAPEGWVEQESYGLQATAQDKGYGLTSLSFKIDGTTVAPEAQQCPDGGCDEKLQKQINMSAYPGGAHEAELVAVDGAGNSAAKRWTINVDPAGKISTSEAVDTLEAVETTNLEVQPVAPNNQVLEDEQMTAGDNPKFVQSDVAIESSGVPDTTSIDLGTSTTTMEGPDSTLEIVPVNMTPGEVEVAADVAAVSSTVAAGTDITVRPEYDGSLIFETIRELASPETFRWHLNLEAGQILKEKDGEYAEVDYQNGAEAFLIFAEVAHDAIGTLVPTHLSVDDEDIVLTVEHRSGNYVYPIIAGQQYETAYLAPTIIDDGIEKATGELAAEIPPELLAQAEAEITPSPHTPDVSEPPYLEEVEEEATGSKVKYKVIKVKKYAECGSSCDHWEIWLAEPKEGKPRFLKTRSGVGWYPKTIVKWGTSQKIWFAPFIDVEENDGGAVPPSIAVRGENKHLTIWARFTVTAIVIVSQDVSFDVTNYLALQTWIWPNGYQQHVLRHWKPKIEVQAN